MASKTIPELQEIATVDADSSFLVIDNGVQTYKIKPINVPGLPRTPQTDLNITLTSTSGDPEDVEVIQAVGIAYADKNLKWRLRFNIICIYTNATFVSIDAHIDGVVFRSGTNLNQMVPAHNYGASADTAKAITMPGDNRVKISPVSGDSSFGFRCSGDVELDEQPTWADETLFTAEGFFFRDAGGDVTSVNGKIGDVVLTTSDIAEGSRPYFTEARAKLAVVDNSITPGVADKAPSEAAVATALNAKQSTSQKNQNNGYPGLDGSGKLLTTQLPTSILGALVYKGSWNAATGTYPSSPSQGQYYIVSTAGIISGVNYAVRDWMVYNGSSWDKVSGSESVASVNGQTGAVILDSDDIAEGATNKYFTDDLARGAAVANAIEDGVTNIAPSQNAVYDALATMDSEKEDVANKGVANGYAPLDADGLIPEENLPAITGGNTVVAIDVTGNSSNKTTEVVSIDDASIERTVPDLPGPDDEPLSLLYIGVGNVDATKKVVIKPASGKAFDWPGLVADNTIDINYFGGWVAVLAAPGAEKYTIQTQANVTVPEATPDILGKNYKPTYITGLSKTGMAHNTIEDVGSWTETLQPGKYIVDLTAILRVQMTSGTLSSGLGNLWITDSSNVSLFGVGGPLITPYVTNDYRTLVCSFQEITISSVTVVKLRGAINVNGGTVSDRSIISAGVKITKMGEL